MLSELQMQAQMTQWFHNTYPLHRGRLRRVKNELDNHPRKTKQDMFKQLSENKATGVMPGDSDLYLLCPDRLIVYIELKTAIGSQSKEQKDFERLVVSCGHLYCLVRSFAEFQTLINEFL